MSLTDLNQQPAEPSVDEVTSARDYSAIVGAVSPLFKSPKAALQAGEDTSLQTKLNAERDAEIEEQNFSNYDAENTAFFSDGFIAGSSVQVAAAVANAAFLNKIAGVSALNIGSGGSLGYSMTREEMAEKQAEEDRDWLDSVIEVGEQRLDQERERQEFDARHNVNQSYAEWSDSDQAFGDFSLKGKGWEKLQKWLEDDENKKKATTALKDKGYTDQQIADIFKANEIMAKPPSTWSDADREFIRVKEDEPKIQAGLGVVKEASMYDSKVSLQQAATNSSEASSSTSYRNESKVDTSTSSVGGTSVNLASLTRSGSVKTSSLASEVDAQSDKTFATAPSAQAAFSLASNPEPIKAPELAVTVPVKAPVITVVENGFT